MAGRVLPFPHRLISPGDVEKAAALILETPMGERTVRIPASKLEEPEVLLALCLRIQGMLDSMPAIARDEAEFLYRFVRVPERPVGLFDEREYFLGELALLAGTACRQLSRRDEARLWFDRSEAGFRHTLNAVADLARLAYQRLALRMEERHLDAVLELVPSLIQSFDKCGLPEEALKARFLEGLAWMEGERIGEAIQAFRDIAADAERLGSEKLLASAYGNLTHLYGMMGDAQGAMECSRLAIPVLRRLNDRVALAKLQWGLATLLRETNQILPAVDAYRSAQKEFEEIGMRADVAALHLVVADLLLELGQDAGAIESVLQALPVIGELQMVSEGMAALQLLRESLRDKRIDREALRELHGYFEEIHS